MIEKKKICILGCGNLGMSILNGLLSDQSINPTDITVTKRNTDSLHHLKDSGISISSDNASAIRNSEIIIVTLKPYNILEELNQLKANFSTKKHLLVSVATGISLKQLSDTLQLQLPIFRAMPNTAADVAMSMTCISSHADNASAYTMVKQCFDTIGTTIAIDEDLMDSATVLGACGIAYVLRFIRGMIQGGIQIGFDSKTATQIVTQTVNGAANLLIDRNNHPEHEIDKVTTPKGCTIAGLNEMEHNGFSSALIKGIVTSYDSI